LGRRDGRLQRDQLLRDPQRVALAGLLAPALSPLFEAPDQLGDVLGVELGEAQMADDRLQVGAEDSLVVAARGGAQRVLFEKGPEEKLGDRLGPAARRLASLPL